MKYQRWFGVIGIILFLWLILKTDVHEILNIFNSSNILLLILAISSNLVIIFFYNIRWQLLLKRINAKVSLKSLFFIWFKGVVPALMTPGRIGELYRSKFVKEQTGITKSKIISTIVVDKMLDFIVLILFSFSGVLYFINVFAFDFDSNYFFILAILLIITMTMLFLRKHSLQFARIIVKMFCPKKFKKSILKHFKDFSDGMELISNKTLFIAFIYTIFNWSVTFIGVYILSLALNTGISLPVIFALVPISSLSSLIPISISGLGTRDVIYVIILSQIGIAKEAALALSISVFVFLNLIHLVIGSVIYIIEEKKS